MMGFIFITWGALTQKYLNKIRMYGKVINSSDNSMSYRLMIAESLTIIDIAKKYGGVLLPISNPHMFKDCEYVCFDIIFKNKKDFEAFHEAIKNRYS